MIVIIHTKTGPVLLHYSNKYQLRQIRETAERRGYGVELPKEKQYA